MMAAASAVAALVVAIGLALTAVAYRLPDLYRQTLYRYGIIALLVALGGSLLWNGAILSASTALTDIDLTHAVPARHAIEGRYFPIWGMVILGVAIVWMYALLFIRHMPGYKPPSAPEA